MKIYTSDEVAGILRVSRAQVYNLIRDGYIKAIKVGRSYRIAAQDLDDYFQGAGKVEALLVTPFDNEAEWMIKYAGVQARRQISLTAADTKGRVLYGMTRNMKAMEAAEIVYVMEIPPAPRRKRIAEMTPEELEEAGAKLVAYRVVRA